MKFSDVPTNKVFGYPCCLFQRKFEKTFYWGLFLTSNIHQSSNSLSLIYWKVGLCWWMNIEMSACISCGNHFTNFTLLSLFMISSRLSLNKYQPVKIALNELIPTPNYPCSFPCKKLNLVNSVNTSIKSWYLTFFHIGCSVVVIEWLNFRWKNCRY